VTDCVGCGGRKASHSVPPPLPLHRLIEHPLCRLTLILQLALVSSALLLGACAAPQLLSAVFGPAVPPKPMEHKPRREPYQRPKPPPMVEVKEEVARTDWAGMLELLPKDAAGGTDWVRALNEKLIQPKPGLDPKAEDATVLDLDVEFVPKGAPEFKSVYSHKVHTQILACGNCHTDIFQMEKGAAAITMEKMLAGESCGRCHGKVAFEIATGCPRCHLEMAK
jgi:c(7)-type cytochrome triheme protein